MTAGGAVLALAVAASASAFAAGLRAAADGRPPPGGVVIVFHEEEPRSREVTVELGAAGRGRAEVHRLDRCGDAAVSACWSVSQREVSISWPAQSRLLTRIARLPMTVGGPEPVAGPGASHAELQVKVGDELAVLSVARLSPGERACWEKVRQQLLEAAGAGAK